MPVISVVVRTLEHLGARLADRWHHATPTDFGMLAITVIIAGWYITRYWAD